MKNVKGFSLIELMIVVAIIGIIASLATTSYNNSVRKTKRADAKASLMDLASQFERCFTVNGQYTTTAVPLRNCSLVSNLDVLVTNPTPSGKGHYNMTLTAISTTSFILTATPTGFIDAECTSFILNDLGQQTATGTTGTLNVATGARCW